MQKPNLKDVALLDGGLGQEIYRRATDVSSLLWSVAVMLEQPEIVKSVHEDFIRAGAKTLTLNTYTATPTRLAKEGLQNQIAQIHQKAFDVLNHAIDATGGDVDIAGCLAPLEGSYRDQPQRSFADLLDEYSQLVTLQENANVFLIETMTNILEATAACAAASAAGKPYGVSFRVEKNGKLKSGETLEDAVLAVSSYAPTAVLLNCSDPEFISAAMPRLSSAYTCVGGYANAFKSIDVVAGGGLVDTLAAREEISPTVYAKEVEKWLADGARVVGGCCEITPQHLAQLNSDLIAKEYNLIRFSQLKI